MTRFTYLRPPTNYSNQQLHSMFMELMKPEFKTREEILIHARRTLAQNISNSGISLEELTENTAELQEQLRGHKPFDFYSFNEPHFILGKNFDECFPYDSDVPVSKYQEIHKKLFGKEPNSEQDSSGRFFVRLYLQEKFFEE